jgi:hypothetical protein
VGEGAGTDVDVGVGVVAAEVQATANQRHAINKSAVQILGMMKSHFAETLD